MTGAPIKERRDGVTVVDISDKLTTEELSNLKDMAKYWSAGKLISGAFIGLGAFAFAVIKSYDFIRDFLNR